MVYGDHESENGDETVSFAGPKIQSQRLQQMHKLIFFSEYGPGFKNPLLYIS